MIKKIGVFCMIFVSMYADEVNVQNNGTINNYGTMNNSQTNKFESEKAKYDVRIMKLAEKIGEKPSSEEQPTLRVVLDAAKKANEFNISGKEKKENCVEYSLLFKVWKINLKLARNECKKIFSE